MDAKSQTNRQSANGKPAKVKKKRVSLLVHFVAMVVVITALLLGALYGLNAYTLHGEEIKVPDLKGKTSQAAITHLQSIGLDGVVDDSVHLKTFTAGAVYDQSVPAGTMVKKDRIVHLTVNSGNAPKLILPDIADNSSLREATVRLTSMGFKLGPTQYRAGEKDWVYEIKNGSRNLSAGSSVDADEEIVLVVGDGTYADMDAGEGADGDEQADDISLIADE